MDYLPRKQDFYYRFIISYGWIGLLLLGIYLILPLQQFQKKALLQSAIPTEIPQSTATVVIEVEQLLPSLSIGLEVDVTETLTPSVFVSPEAIVPQQLLVKFRPGVTGQDIAATMGHAMEPIPFLSDATGVFKIVLTQGEDPLVVADLYRFHPGVERVEMNKKVSGFGMGMGLSVGTPVIPGDPSYSSQWALSNGLNHDINAPEAWSVETGKSSVKIAVLDSGIDGTHEDLTGKVDEGINFVGYGRNTPTPASAVTPAVIAANTNSDDEGHGTSAAGIISASTDNGKGIAGVSWNSRLVPVKVLDYNRNGDTSNLASAIIWAANRTDIQIICMSLGTTDSSFEMEAAVKAAYDKGKVLIAASGNEDKQGVYYPAAYTQAIAVGATNQSDVRCDKSDWGTGKGSSYGPQLDVLAPGNAIFTTALQSAAGNTYTNFTGTSAAAPNACGVAALLLSKDPTLSNQQVLRRLEVSSTKPSGMSGSNFTNEYGYGRIDAYRALTYDVYPPSVVISTPTGTLPSRPTFSGVVSDDRQDNDKVAAELADVSSSTIQSLEVSIDSGAWIDITPVAKSGSFSFSYAVDSTLSNGQHTLRARATDSEGNVPSEANYTASSFSVSDVVTPFPTITPTGTPTGTSTPIRTSTPLSTFTSTPVPSMGTVVATASPTITQVRTGNSFETKVLYRYYLTKDKKTFKDYPMSGVKVVFSDEPWESYTNLEGLALFSNIVAGKHLVSAFYGTTVKQMEVTIPTVKSLILIFEPQTQSLTTNTNATATPSSGSNNSSGMPVTGMDIAYLRRVIFGLVLIVLTGVWRMRVRER
ncbi:MAG: S8 family serine peptidase [bacterium]